MRTAFGIALFILVYAPIAYMVYDELTGRRSPIRSLLGRRARLAVHPDPVAISVTPGNSRPLEVS